MDALSALNVMAGPQASGGLARSIQAAVTSATKSIPSAELSALTPAPNSDAPTALTSTSAPAGAGFESLLGNFVGDVTQKQAAASDAVAGLLSGKNVSLHQTMISMEEANISFQMMVEVRNKLLDSYQELMRMQI
jgi:flagellar hook-basal body complex protein FliE